MASRILAGAIADVPVERKGRLLYPILRRGEINLRKSKAGQRMPTQQIQSPDLFIGIAPGEKTFPEDNRRYEIKTNEDGEDKTFHVKIEEYKDEDGLFRKRGYVKYVTKNKDGEEQEIEKPFMINYHNRVGVSQYFKDYNSKDNGYRPLKGRMPFLSIFSDKPDTLIDEMVFNEMYK